MLDGTQTVLPLDYTPTEQVRCREYLRRLSRLKIAEGYRSRGANVSNPHLSFL